MLLGMTPDQVDALYKSLFVYTAGFSNSLSEILQHTTDNYFVLSSFWKLFLILLENVCSLDYEMAITHVEIASKAAVSNIEKEFAANLRETEV